MGGGRSRTWLRSPGPCARPRRRGRTCVRLCPACGCACVRLCLPVAVRPAAPVVSVPTRRPSVSRAAGPPAGPPFRLARRITHPWPPWHRTPWIRKTPEKLLAPAGTRTPNCAGASSGRLEEGRGMDSVTRGSGIALSALIAATASILLLLPGKPAGSWRGPGTPGRVVMAWAAATSTSNLPGPGSQPSASSRAGGQPVAGPRPGCHATGAGSGRTQPGLTSLRPGTTSLRPGTTSLRPGTTSLQPGPTNLRPSRARSGAARPGSCRPPRAHRHQHASRR
jgi:hypothetical protein